MIMEQPEEIITPPESLEYNKDGKACFFLPPTDDELRNSDSKQWVWIVNNNNPDKKFRKQARMAYITDEQWKDIEITKEKLHREERMYNNVMLYFFQTLYPKFYKNINIENENDIHNALWKTKQSEWLSYDIQSKLLHFAWDARDKKVTEDDIEEYIFDYIREYERRSSEEKWKELNERMGKLTPDEMLLIKIRMIGAVRAYITNHKVGYM